MQFFLIRLDSRPVAFNIHNIDGIILVLFFSTLPKIRFVYLYVFFIYASV